MKQPWLVVAGDLTPLGGMDMANYALARHLADRGVDLHLVTHRVWPDLDRRPGVTVHRVWRPFGRHLLGSPLLAREGQRLWRRLSRETRALVNGGNCPVPAANWVHYLHAAFRPEVAGPRVLRAKAAYAYQRDLTAERSALAGARLVICNSQRTRRDVVERIGVRDELAHVVYYGSDAARFAQIQPEERLEARRAMGFANDRPLVGFVGALGDRRKAFDTLFTAWCTLCASRRWDADLVVVGTGAELPVWRARAGGQGCASRFRFLGFRDDVPRVLAALDALVHPARYEAYGLSVHEAICRGLPALVTASAGVAERYPAGLETLLIADPDDSHELVERLRGWRENLERYRTLVAPFSESLRARSWDQMAQQIVALAGRAA